MPAKGVSHGILIKTDLPRTDVPERALRNKVIAEKSGPSSRA